MNWSELRTVTAITRREFQLGVRAPVFWTLLFLGACYALWRGLSAGATSALACYQVAEVAAMGLGVVGILTGGAAASRDQRDRARELVLAKPRGSAARLVVARFLGVWLTLLALLLLFLAVVFLSQLVRGGTPWQLEAYGNAFARSLTPLALAVSLGFVLTTAVGSPLAGAIAAVYWVAVPLARAHLPAVLDVTTTQQWPMAALFAAGLLGLTIVYHGKAISGVRRRGIALGTTVLLAGGVLAALLINARGYDAITEPDPLLLTMAHQNAKAGDYAPGFWLPDADRRIVGLGDFAGRPTVLVFWGPTESTSAELLPALAKLADRYHQQGLAVIAICLDKDSATLAPFAREVGKRVVMLWDPGSHFTQAASVGDLPGESSAVPWVESPAAAAYAIQNIPSVFLIDRNRILESATGVFDAASLEAAAGNLVGAR